MSGSHLVDTFNKTARNLTRPDELHQLLEAVTLELGFDFYALLHHVDLTPYSASLRHMQDGALVALTTYPEAWVADYVETRIVENDPVLLASHKTAVGFAWDDIPDLIPVSQEHREIRARTERAGIGAGFTVPANLPGEANGSCNFAMRTGRALPIRNLQTAQLIGSFAFQAARTMVTRARRGALPPVVRLTERQLDCVRLAARGKTDPEIAIILGVREGTVRRHFEDARMRYGVGTRVQVIMRAMFEGQIGLVDALR